MNSHGNYGLGAAPLTYKPASETLRPGRVFISLTLCCTIEEEMKVHHNLRPHAGFARIPIKQLALYLCPPRSLLTPLA